MNSQIIEIPLEQLDPAPWNPRTVADPAGLTDLTDSIRERGVLVPLLVRPTDVYFPVNDAPPRYEIVAGHRRALAATAAALTTVPCVVRELDDHTAQTEGIVDNLQRENLSPFDEAKAFRALLDFTGEGQTAAVIGKHLGKSERYVWERVRLLELVPDAQQLLQDGILPLPHALILSALKPDDQMGAIDQDEYNHECPLFKADGGFDFDDEKKKLGKWDGLKPVSARELQRWVHDHVRFDPAQAAAAAPLDFGAVAEQVQAATEKPGRGKKVVSITFDSYVHPDAKDDGERTYSARTWKRADGEEQSKRCDHAVLGVVVVGHRYGETFDVCVKKGCPVHWPEDKKTKAKTDPGAAPPDAGNSRESYEHQEALRKRTEEAWKTVYPQFVDAVVKATIAVKTTDKHLVEALNLDRATPVAKVIKNAVGSITYKTFGRAFTLYQALANIHVTYYNDYQIARALKVTKAKFDPKAAMKAVDKALEKAADDKKVADVLAAAKAAPAKTKKPASATTTPKATSAKVKKSAKNGKAR